MKRKPTPFVIFIAHKSHDRKKAQRHYLTVWNEAGSRWMWGFKKDAKTFINEATAREWAAENLTGIPETLHYCQI